MASTRTTTTGTTTKHTRRAKARAGADPGPRTRRTPIYRYEVFLAALAKYRTAPDFPVSFFDDTKFAATLGQYISDVNQLAGLTDGEKKATGQERAVRTRLTVVYDKCVAALVGFYGPTSKTLNDFGIRPKSATHRRKKKVAHAAATGAGSGTGSGSSPPAAPVGPTLVPTSPPSSAPPLAAAPPESPAPSSARLSN